MNVSLASVKSRFILVVLLFFVPRWVTGQEKPSAPVADSAESLATAPSGAALNATDEELAGILSPEDREAAVQRWEKSIAGLEKLDQTEPEPEGGILLLGSSSIKLWEDAAEMLAPYPVIRRGYGGARFSDLVVFARRLTSPHQYRAVVIFVANDIAGRESDRRVDAVRKMVLHIVEVAREHEAEAPILLVDVTPTPSRAKAWPDIRKLNAMLREVALTQPSVYHVPTAEYYLTVDDQPRPELFREDQLHQNQAGYEIFAHLIARRLDEVLDK